MSKQTQTCSGCGGTAFNVHADGTIVCEHCGAQSAKVEKTYNRAVKQESGHGSLWDGLASFLLFEHISGGLFGCFAGLLVFGFLCSGMGFFAWKTAKRREARNVVQNPKKPQMSDEEKQARSMQWVSRAADKVQKESRFARRILNTDEANSKMFPRNDAWNRPLFYRADGKNTFTIRSAGKDGKQNTEDDIVEQRTIEKKTTEKKTELDSKPRDRSASQTSSER